jgi:hypothetical protein
MMKTLIIATRYDAARKRRSVMRSWQRNDAILRPIAHRWNSSKSARTATLIESRQFAFSRAATSPKIQTEESTQSHEYRVQTYIRNYEQYNKSTRLGDIASPPSEAKADVVILRG